MAIVQGTPQAVITKALSELNERAGRAIIRNLAVLGEQTVNMVRGQSEAESWQDQTGNLRSSIGYVLVHDREIVGISDFPKVQAATNGATAGRALAETLARTFTGYALIVVAGMHYASYVEAMPNKHVLERGELWARQEAPKMMERLKKNIEEAAKAL